MGYEEAWYSPVFAPHTNLVQLASVATHQQNVEPDWPVVGSISVLYCIVRALPTSSQALTSKLLLTTNSNFGSTTLRVSVCNTLPFVA